MVERVGFGEGLMSWKDSLDVTLQSYSKGHIDVWIENSMSNVSCFLTGFYGHWSVQLCKNSWTPSSIVCYWGFQ